MINKWLVLGTNCNTGYWNVGLNNAGRSNSKESNKLCEKLYKHCVKCFFFENYFTPKYCDPLYTNTLS